MLLTLIACIGLAGCSSTPLAASPTAQRPISADQLQEAFPTHAELEKAVAESLTFKNAAPTVSPHASWFSQASDANSLSAHCKSLITRTNAVEPLAAVNVYDSAETADGQAVTIQATHFPSVAAASKALTLASSFLIDCGESLESVASVAPSHSTVPAAVGLRLRLRSASAALTCTYGSRVNILVLECGPTQKVADAVTRMQYAAISTAAQPAPRHASARTTAVAPPPTTGSADDLTSQCVALAARKLPAITAPLWDGAAPVKVSQSGTAISLRGSNGVVTCIKEFGVVQVRGVLNTETLDSVPDDQIERNGNVVLFGGTIELTNGLRLRVDQGESFTPSADAKGPGLSMP